MKALPPLYLATGNAHKVEEIAEIFNLCGVELRIESAAEIGGMPPVDEYADTFAGNARLKADALHEKAQNAWVLADDSGLVVDALNGAPGVHSARYAGPDATTAANNAKLLDALSGHPENHRSARFVCFLQLLGPDVDELFEGRCEGRIVGEASGATGFGYDPLFLPLGYQRTFAELGSEIKNTISHRARAVQRMADWLRART